MKIHRLIQRLLIASGIALMPGMIQAQLANGILNYWDLDGNAEDTASAFTGSTGTTDDDGTLAGTVGAATFATGLFGQAVDFERTIATDGRVEIPDSPDVVRAGLDVSISLWVQGDSTDTQQNNWQGLVAKGESTDYRIAHGNAADNVAYAGGIGDLQGASTLYTGADWHHVVASTTEGGTARLYVDGILAGESAVGASITDNGSGFLFIGGNPNAAGARMFDGMIDDVVMWDRPLTDDEVTLIYEEGLKGNAFPALLVTGDDDGDGMDDGWEERNGLNPALDDSAEDPDNDGLTNLEEWNDGDNSTKPMDADSDDDDLNDGVEVNTHGTDPNDVDSDDDGLNDGAEIAASTLPLDADTDDDEMGDGYEVDNGHNPLLAADAAEDADNDGSLNLEECQRGTDPNEQDTDMDGLSDGVEDGGGTFVSAAMTGTDPLDADTDNDGLNDGDELTAGTDPFDPDTDGDTVPDGVDDDPLSSGEGIGFGLVSYWPLDADLLDAADDNHGTEDGGVIPFEAGKFDNAIKLDGAQNVIITGGDEDEFDFTGGSMTVSVWCTAAAIDTNWQCLIAKGEGNGWRVHRRGGDEPPEFSWTGGNGDTPSHGTPIMIGTDPETWHHVVGVTDGATGIESLYIDNVEVATKEGAVLANRNNRMRIGENPDALGRGWNGKIDDVAIWARALSADEIAEIWDEGDGVSIEVLLGGGARGLTITDISVAASGDVSLTWNSKKSPGTSYGVFSTNDLSLPLDQWSEIDDSVATQGESTTYSIPSGDLGNEDKLFFYVRKN